VSRAMSLARINFVAGGFLIIIIEHLDLTHTHVGGIAFTGIADSQAVVAAWRQLELQARDIITEFFFSKNGAAFFRTAGDRAVLYLVVFQRAGPRSEEYTSELQSLAYL